MNERIKKIALAAGGSHYPEVGGNNLETFARLLIDESVNFLKLNDCDFEAEILANYWDEHGSHQ